MATARSLLSLSCVVLALCIFTSCTNIPKGPGGAVTKVKTYDLNPSTRLRAADPSLTFERSYHLHGAVTAAEQLERAGQYYTVMWQADDRSQPVTVRFEYRQQKTGLKAKSQELNVSDIRGSNTTKFSVAGAVARADGPVTAWRVLLVRGNETLATAESYLWN
jgi:hypothetical protein